LTLSSTNRLQICKRLRMIGYGSFTGGPSINRWEALATIIVIDDESTWRVATV